MTESDLTPYRSALDRLEALDRRLALAAYLVDALHPDAEAVATPILQFLRHRFGQRDVLDTYVERARQLHALQERFDRDPRPETLSGPGAAVDRDAYNISLLLSIAFTNHRFEIMQQLDQFLAGCQGARGAIASIGTGTGYELYRMASLLPDRCTIESYDIEESVQDDARAFLQYLGIARPVRWAREFPLAAPPAHFHRRYDAIVMCELLEHLPSPASALAAASECLGRDGRMFVTMAINIAQEDHVFLYPDIASCRAQIRDAGLRIISEWITPQTTLPPPANREGHFKRGNFVAVLSR